MISAVSSPSAAVFLAQRLGKPVLVDISYGGQVVEIHGSRFDQAPQAVRDEYADDTADNGYLKTAAEYLYYFQYKGQWYSHEQQYALISVYMNAIENHADPYAHTIF